MTYKLPGHDNSFDDRTDAAVASRINQLMGNGLGSDIWVVPQTGGKSDSYIWKGGVWSRKDSFGFGKRVASPKVVVSGAGVVKTVIGFIWEDGVFAAHDVNSGEFAWPNGMFLGAKIEKTRWMNGLWCGTQMMPDVLWHGGVMIVTEAKRFDTINPRWMPGHRTLVIGPGGSYRMPKEWLERASANGAMVYVDGDDTNATGYVYLGGMLFDTIMNLGSAFSDLHYSCVSCIASKYTERPSWVHGIRVKYGLADQLRNNDSVTKYAERAEYLGRFKQLFGGA